jgi:hypothetical protein
MNFWPLRRRIKFTESLRLYWKYLIGIALFPWVACFGVEVFHIPGEYIAALFFGVAFLAGWPWLGLKAPYSFWIFACGIYMMAFIQAILVLHLFKTIIR